MAKLKHINYAELHIYYPFYLSTTMSQRKLHKKILKSSLVCNQKYYNKTREAVSTYVNNIINDVNTETDDFHLKFSDENDIPKKTFFKPSKINPDYDDLELIIDDNNNKINFSINSIELEEINKRMEQLELEFNASETYYGENYIKSQERFILKPFKVELKNNTTVWGNAILILFPNKIGIIKLELPLINVKTKPLKEMDFDKYIKYILLLLQKTINVQSFFEKAKTHHSLDKAKTNYYNNRIFLLQLQEDCYASVTEQLAAIQTMMPEYLKNDLSSAKINAVDKILEIKKSNINNTFQYFISICGLLLNLIFGLPAIKDTLIILRNYFGITNIKYITLDGASFILWLLSNTLIIIILLTLRHKIKR